MEKKKTKQEGVEVSREDRYVDRCGTGLLDGQRHARVDQKQTNHIAQPRAPCNMRQNYSLVCWNISLCPHTNCIRWWAKTSHCAHTQSTCQDHFEKHTCKYPLAWALLYRSVKIRKCYFTQSRTPWSTAMLARCLAYSCIRRSGTEHFTQHSCRSFA